MILSVSRRTDVLSYYLDWFLNRLQEGWLMVRNPMNPKRVSRIPLSPEVVECIVFWTKNPEALLARMHELDKYMYYIQFTINPYGDEIETRLPSMESRVETFRILSQKLGKERMVWRYSPVLISDTYPAGRHIEEFENLADALSEYTNECKLSFLEIYPKIKKRMASMGVEDKADAEKFDLARRFIQIARKYGIKLSSCGKPDLRPAGVPHASCIDGKLIQRLTHTKMNLKKDPGQRKVCQCVESVDVGTYQTCLNGCAYCYANNSYEAASCKAEQYDPTSPFLCDVPREDDVVVDRKIKTHALEPMIF